MIRRRAPTCCPCSRLCCKEAARLRGTTNIAALAGGLVVVRRAHRSCRKCAVRAVAMVRCATLRCTVRIVDAACVVAVQSRMAPGLARVCSSGFVLTPRDRKGALCSAHVLFARHRGETLPARRKRAVFFGATLLCDPLAHRAGVLYLGLVGQDVARLRRLPRPAGEGEDPQCHQVDQRHQHQQRPPLREAGAQQDLPHRNTDHQQHDQQAEQSAHRFSPSVWGGRRRQNASRAAQTL